MSWGTEAVEREEAGHRGVSIQSQDHGEDKTATWMEEKQSISKPELNMLKIVLIILILFSYHYLLFPYYYFALMFQVAMYCHLEKQELDMHWFYCRYAVQILVIQVKWSTKVNLAFSSIDSSLISLFVTNFNIY